MKNKKYLGALEHKKGNIYKVNLVHNMPFDSTHGLGKTEKELEISGVLVDEISDPEDKKGFIPIMYVDIITKDIMYEYVEIPLTAEEKATKKIEELELLQKENDRLLVDNIYRTILLELRTYN